MPANATNSRPRPDHSTLQLPCGHPSCQRYFKTAAGRTKHRLSAHPIIPQPVSAPCPPSPELLDPGNDQQREDDVPFNADEVPRPLSPPADVNAEFYGPKNQFYRNYHKGLDGE
jgi:hypothetical protein